MPTAIIVDSTDALALEVARRFEATARAAIEATGRVAVALTGGSVARLCFPRLAQVDIDWSLVEVFYGDERAVPPADAESNHGLVAALLLSRVPLGEDAVHRMRGEAADLQAAADEYQAELVRVLGDPPRLDIAILGVGPDGHVCSLFPGASLFDESERWVAAVEDAPKPPPRRLTLTMATLLSARAILVVASGDAKAEAVAAALTDDDSELPVAVLAREAAEVMFLIDREAAGQL